MYPVPVALEPEKKMTMNANNDFERISQKAKNKKTHKISKTRCIHCIAKRSNSKIIK